MNEGTLKNYDKTIAKGVIHKANILNDANVLLEDIKALKNLHCDFSNNASDFTVFSLVINQGYSHNISIELENKEIISELLLSLIIDKVKKHNLLIEEFNNE